MKYKVTLNNKVYEVEVEETTAMLVEEYEALAPAPAAPAAAPVVPAASTPPAAPAAPAPTGGEPVPAPMPGTILQVKAAPGMAVKKGDLLVVLEAMKMENEILAPRDGTVVQVPVAKGAAVETGAPLVILA